MERDRALLFDILLPGFAEQRQGINRMQCLIVLVLPRRDRLLLLIAVGVVFSIYGCNTVRGIGQDIEKAGDAIQRSTK